MDRNEGVLKYITREQRGIEIGPFHNPLVPRRLGYRPVIVDVFDKETLRARALGDPNIPKDSIELIEEVDIVGSCTDLADLIRSKYDLGSFDYVVSSHNFEHLPDPIRFLRSCEMVLRPGGFLSMAVPDRRACFDYFRPVTTSAIGSPPISRTRATKRSTGLRTDRPGRLLSPGRRKDGPRLLSRRRSTAGDTATRAPAGLCPLGQPPRAS